MVSHFVRYFGKGLFQLIFHPTHRCNSRCFMCFNRDNLAETGDGDLTLAEIRKISGSMPAFPWLMLSGGEPFLRDDLCDVVEVFHERNRVRHLTIPTNASMPGRVEQTLAEILERCPRVTVNLAVSLDGLHEAHDRIRGADGSFDRLIETWERVRGLRGRFDNLELKINTVLGDYNRHDLPGICEFVRGLEPDMHSIDFVRPPGNGASAGFPPSRNDAAAATPPPENNAEGIHPLPGDGSDAPLPMLEEAPDRVRLPPEEEIGRLVETVRETFRTYNGYKTLGSHFPLLGKLSGALTEAYYDFFLEFRENPVQLIPCYAGKLNAVLYPRGDLGFCELLEPVGNVRDAGYDFEKVWRSEKAHRLRQSIARADCACYHPCYQLTNLLYRPARVMKRMVRGRAG